MAGTVVSPLLKGLVRKLRSIIDEPAASTTKLKGELEPIVAHLQSIVAMVGDAESQALSNPAVSRLLENLQKLLYTLDNLLDELQHMTSNQVSSSSFSLRFIFPLKSNLYPPLHKVYSDLVQIAEEWSEFSKDSFHVVTDVKPQDGIQPSTVSPYFREKDVIGREHDADTIIALISKFDERVSVVPIIGPLGIGKTTLAKLIYNNSTFVSKFDLKVWMDLGNSDADPWTIFQNRDLITICGDIEQRKMKIQNLLESKRVLIVLDHFRDTTLQKSAAREIIDDILFKGSSVIVTTRSRRAASSIGTTPAYQLQPLSQDASSRLFTDSMHIHGERERMAMEFVKLSCGVPLVLHLIKNFLDEKNSEREWTGLLHDIQDNSFVNVFNRNFSGDIFGIPPPLRLLLPSFRLGKASCGGLSVQQLTCKWMALGFLYSDDTDQSPEIIARKYLKQFVETSLGPDVQYAPGGVVRSINFIEPLYESATISADQSWVIVRHERMLHATFVHVIWDQDCLNHIPSDCIRNPEDVRLFVVVSSTRRRDSSVQFVKDIISSLVSLRVLGLSGCNIEMLPDSIGSLKYLKYLDLGRNLRMKSLPDSICTLWHLETLFLHGCNQLQKLPSNIGRLQNLRYLTLTILTESLPEALGQLTSLRTLGLTSCPNLVSLPSTLKNLNLETLAMVNCPVLDFAANSSIEGFKGLDAVHTLLLSHLPKFAGFPSDLGNPSVALRHLQIQSCTRLTETKWIAQFRYLRSLSIEDYSQVLDLAWPDGTSQLNGLLELVIRRCPDLGCTAWIKQFVSLRSLIIDACPKLVELDAGFRELSGLGRLEIRGCPALSEWLATPAGKNWHHIAHVQVIQVDDARL